MDGVLLDSEKFITRAGVEMFREKGYIVSESDFLEFTGMGENRFLGGVAEKYGIPFFPEIDKARTYEIYKELVKDKLKPLPGVISFIEKCKSKSLKIAVATSADLIKMNTNLKEIGLHESIFDTTINGLEVIHKKPDPEIFIKAAERLKLKPNECLVVEDAPSGLAAARAAGCRCLVLTTSFPSDIFPEADWISSDLSTAPDDCLNW